MNPRKTAPTTQWTGSCRRSTRIARRKTCRTSDWPPHLNEPARSSTRTARTKAVTLLRRIRIHVILGTILSFFSAHIAQHSNYMSARGFGCRPTGSAADERLFVVVLIHHGEVTVFVSDRAALIGVSKKEGCLTGLGNARRRHVAPVQAGDIPMRPRDRWPDGSRKRAASSPPALTERRNFGDLKSGRPIRSLSKSCAVGRLCLAGSRQNAACRAS